MSKSKKDKLVYGSEGWIREKASDHLKREDTFTWIRDVFDSSVIAELEDPVSAKSSLVAVPYRLADGLIYFEPEVEISKEQVIKQRMAQANELTGPIVWKNEAKRLAFGAVLVPGEPDSDGDILTAEKIADVAHDWLADYGNIDLQHSLNNAALPVESFILPFDMEVKLAGVDSILPKGSWVLGSRISDDVLWDKVQKGELTGYSIMGVRRAAIKSAEDAALKRTMLKDLGADWVAPFVSLVDAPAVPKAKFFAIKAKEVKPEHTDHEATDVKESESIKQEEKKTSPLGIIERLFKQEKKMTEDEIKSIIQASVKEAISALKEEVQATESPSTDDEEKKPEGEGEVQAEPAAAEGEEKKDETETTQAEVEALKAQVKSLQAEVSKSRSLKAADEPAPQASEPDRDAFGRKIRK